MMILRYPLVVTLLFVGPVVDSVFGKELTLTQAPSTSQAMTVIYDPMDGNLSVDAGGLLLSTLEINRASDIFDKGHLAPDCQTIFDLSPHKIFILDTAGVAALDCGPVLPSQLTAAQLIADLDVNGSFLPSGSIDQFVDTSPHLYVVPEPNSVALLLLCLAPWIPSFRRVGF